MKTIRRSEDRGTTRIGWLDSKHSFSFGDYRDPAHHHFRALRVINDDIIAGGGGFDPHPHRDMEIITYVLQGELIHRDSMGNGSTIRPGNWQKMSAGTGVVHSEFNSSDTEPLHLLQIWIMPNKKGIPPSYSELQIPVAQKQGRWAVAAASDGRAGSIPLQADAVLRVAELRPGDRLSYELSPGHDAWLHVATGEIQVDGLTLKAGDALAMEDETMLQLTGVAAGEVLLFELS